MKIAIYQGTGKPAEVDENLEIIRHQTNSAAAKGADVIYRVLMRRTEQYLYYSLDEAAGIITVLTIWGSRRGRGPTL